MADFIWRQNDRPVRWVVLYRPSDNNKVVDVSAAATTVKVKFRLHNEDESLWEVTCTKEQPADGIVKFEVPAGGLDYDQGPYQMEFYKTENGLIETALNIMSVDLKPELGDVS